MNAINSQLITTAQHTLEKKLSLPLELKSALPVSPIVSLQIRQHRQTIQDILAGHDPRLLVITGPCSIHDPKATLEYAQKLKQLQEQVKDQIFIVMRTYIEKPRTTVGWKGFLYDPDLNGSADMQKGLEQSRSLFIQIAEMGLPLATEILSPMATGYFDDLISWSAIGARTSESQIHREISSHMPYSIGFKNATDGSIQIALDAIQSASQPHQFLGLSQDGAPSILSSKGNPHAHLILRGSNQGTNYQFAEIKKIQENNNHVLPALIIDCSHGNSAKNPLNQPAVLKQIVNERPQTQVRGVMLESFLVDGNQKISDHMTYGQSVTDGCLGWLSTEQLILDVAQQLS